MRQSFVRGKQPQISQAVEHRPGASHNVAAADAGLDCEYRSIIMKLGELLWGSHNFFDDFRQRFSRVVNVGVIGQHRHGHGEICGLDRE